MFNSFTYAQFEHDKESLKQLTTAELYTILVDKAGEYVSSIPFKSTVKSIKVYQAEQISDTETVIVEKIEVEMKVGDFAPNRYDQLGVCEAMKK